MPKLFELDNIIPFKRNRKSYLVIESINVKKEFEKDVTIVLISKKIRTFLKLKHNQKVFIHGVLGYGFTDFEKQVYESIGFNKYKELDNNVVLYELDSETIKKYDLAPFFEEKRLTTTNIINHARFLVNPCLFQSL